MKKVKMYFYLFLVMLSCFNLGGYACSTLRYNEPVELHRWVMTSMFGLMFLGNFLLEFKHKGK